MVRAITERQPAPQGWRSGELWPARLRLHPNDNEYVLVSNVVQRLYLATRMVMDVGQGQVEW